MVLDASQGGGGYLPPDLQLTNEDAAKTASSVSASSYTKTIDLPLVKYKKYMFQASYLYLAEDGKSEVEGDRSPWLETTFDIPNNTKPVINLVLTPGLKSYGIKFDFQAGSEHEDVIVYESLTGAFAGEQYIVYVGTSNSMSINTADFAPRWVKVVTRDRWLDTNISSTIAGPVTPGNAEVDTFTAPAAPSNASVVGSIDADDLTGFKAKITASWTASSDSNVNGYVIRWSSQNPATTTNPVWEYGQVDGRSTSTFSITGLTPNTLYYWQVTAKSPYNAISWAAPQSGTVGPIVDSSAPPNVWTQLKSIISIGGKTADLFKIGTGIAQSINTSTDTTPTQVSGTYSGIILNRSTTNYGHNYWLNTGQFRVGGPSSFLYWDGSDIYTTGKINATGGTFSGNVQVSTGGSLYAGSLTGARVIIQPSGLFAHDSTGAQTVTIQSADGKIDARKGYIGGWTIDGTAQTTGSIYSSNTKLESNGNLTVGDTSGTLASIVRLSANDTTYRLWVGSQTAANAPFKVTKDGKLYATGAVLGTGSTIDGYTTTGTTTAINTRLTTVEGSYVSTTTLNTGLATKNTTFVQGTTPTAVRAGDIWIDTANGNEIKTWTGSTWTSRRDTTFAKTTDLNSKLNATAYIIQSAVDNKISADAAGFEVYAGSSSTSSSGVKITSAGILGYKNGNPTFTITSGGDATFYGALSGATGTFSGRLTVNTATDTSAYIDSAGTLNGVTGLVVGSIGFKNTTIGGWTSHCYPYWGGGANYDLGTQTYRWNDARLSGSLMVGHSGAANDSVGTMKTKLLPSGNIYANTLGVNSGTSIVQDSSGYMRVSSSSRRYKDNISYLSESGYLDIIDQLKPATFKYKQEFMGDSVPVLTSGLIAEDVEQIEELITIVNYNDAGEVESVSYDRLAAYLVLAIKEIKNRLDAIGA